MNPAIVPYIPALAAVTGTIAITAVLAFVSAAVTGGKSLHDGLAPTDIATFPFRAFRSHHNALENTPIFAATTAFAILVSANPTLVNAASIVLTGSCRREVAFSNAAKRWPKASIRGGCRAPAAVN